jgi:hypothetical protein
MKDRYGCDVGKLADKKYKEKERKKDCLSAGGVALAPEQESQGENLGSSVTACRQGTTETSPSCPVPVSSSLVHLFKVLFSSLEAIKLPLHFSLNLRTPSVVEARL